MDTFIPRGTIHGPILPQFILTEQITAGAKIMYALLCNHASQKNRCWPSHATLAKELSCSVSSVKRYLAELVGVKLIRARQEQYRSNVYYMLQPADLEKADTQAARAPETTSQQPKAACRQPDVSYDQPKVNHLNTLKKQEEKKNPPLPPVSADQPRTASAPQAPSARGGGSFFADFESLCAVYPKKEALEGARGIWRKLRKNGQLPSLPDLLAAIKRFMATTQWQKDHGRYVPKLSNFLRDQRWLDPLSDEEAAENRKRLEAERMELARKQAEEAETARSREQRERLRPIFNAFTARFSAEARQANEQQDNMRFGTWRHSYGKYAGPTAADVPDGTDADIMNFLESYKHQRKQDAYRASHQATPLAPQPTALLAALPAHHSHSANRENKPVSLADILRSANPVARIIPAPQPLRVAV